MSLHGCVVMLQHYYIYSNNKFITNYIKLYNSQAKPEIQQNPKSINYRFTKYRYLIFIFYIIYINTYNHFYLFN